MNKSAKLALLLKDYVIDTNHGETYEQNIKEITSAFDRAKITKAEFDLMMFEEKRKFENIRTRQFSTYEQWTNQVEKEKEQRAKDLVKPGRGGKSSIDKLYEVEEEKRRVVAQKQAELEVAKLELQLATEELCKAVQLVGECIHE